MTNTGNAALSEVTLTDTRCDPAGPTGDVPNGIVPSGAGAWTYCVSPHVPGKRSHFGFLSDTRSSAVSGRLLTDSEHAQRNDVTGTPTLFVGPTGGTLTKVELASATDLASIEKANAAVER